MPADLIPILNLETELTKNKTVVKNESSANNIDDKGNTGYYFKRLRQHSLTIFFKFHIGQLFIFPGRLGTPWQSNPVSRCF